MVPPAASRAAPVPSVAPHTVPVPSAVLRAAPVPPLAPRAAPVPCTVVHRCVPMLPQAQAPSALEVPVDYAPPLCAMSMSAVRRLRLLHHLHRSRRRRLHHLPRSCRHLLHHLHQSCHRLRHRHRCLHHTVLVWSWPCTTRQSSTGSSHPSHGDSVGSWGSSARGSLRHRWRAAALSDSDVGL
jgi:hypothetical protein